MQGPGIKSKPSYSPLAADLSGAHHLLVGHGRGGEALIRLYQGFGGKRYSAEIHYAQGPSSGEGLVADVARLDADRTTIYETVDDLLAVLPAVLEGCRMGTQLSRRVGGIPMEGHGDRTRVRDG